MVCPYIKSARKFISYNYRDVFGSLIKLNQHFPAIQTLFLLNLLAWVTIKLIGLAKRTRVLGNKDCHPLLELTEARGERSGSSCSPTPLIVKLWHICGIPGWAWQMLVSDSFNVIIKKASKGTIDPAISQWADGETFMFFCHKLSLREVCSWDIGFARRSSIHEPKG